MSYMSDRDIEAHRELPENQVSDGPHVPDPHCCPDCYRHYWAMVESGELVVLEAELKARAK